MSEPYYMAQARQAMEQANAIDARQAGSVPQMELVLKFAQVQATLAVADAVERLYRATLDNPPPQSMPNPLYAD